MILKLEYCNVENKMFTDVAPNHVNRFKKLVEEKNMMELFFTELLMGLWLKL